MKLIHTADWHLSSQRSRLDPDTGLSARLMDFYRCARFAIEDGVERGAQLVLHAGDTFHGCRPSPTEVRLCRNALLPAIDAGVPVVMLLGNHDAPRSPAEKHALDLLREDNGVTVVDWPRLLFCYARDGEPGALYTQPSGDPDLLRLQIACLPYPNKQLLLGDEEHRRLEPGALNQLVREKMMDCLAGLHADVIGGVPTVLLGHFSVDLAQAGGQNRLMMLGGEWTLNVHELAGSGFDYYALGHIHKPQRVWFDEGRSMVYCGSPEAVTFGEEGEEKGYVLASVEAGRADFEWVSTPYRRFITLEVGNGAALPPPEELAGAIVRVRAEQADDVDVTALRRDLEAAGAHEYQIETRRAETVRRRAVEVSAETGLDDALRAYVAQRPDLEPMTDELISEARRVESALAEEGDRR